MKPSAGPRVGHSWFKVIIQLHVSSNHWRGVSDISVSTWTEQVGSGYGTLVSGATVDFPPTAACNEF